MRVGRTSCRYLVLQLALHLRIVTLGLTVTSAAAAVRGSGSFVIGAPWRPIDIGVQGFADAFLWLHYPLESEPAKD